MSGRILLCWRHKITFDVVRQRYLTSKIHKRTLHMEIGNLFFSEFSKDESESKTDGCKYTTFWCYIINYLFKNFCVSILPSIVINVLIITAVSKDGETVIHNDMTYSLRHVEESWIHLLKAGK